MNRESGLKGFRLAVLAIVGMALMSGAGALSSCWLICSAISAGAGQPEADRAQADRAQTDRAQTDRDNGDPDPSFEADPTSEPFVSEPPVLEDFACDGAEGQADKTVQGQKPDRGDDSEDWLFALAMIMGLAEGWTDDAGGAWNSCQM
jgi:hypothetical protein